MQISAFPSYVSKELFSTRFLDHLIKERSEWTEARADALVARETLRKLYEKNKKQLPTMKEAQLEESWVRPVFKALGVAYDVQLCLPTSNTQVTKSPDYALFADAEALQEAAPFRDHGGVEYYRRASVIGEAKSWGTSFYKSANKGEGTPEAQLALYLFLTSTNWGLLTNGRLWRLVHRSTAGRFDCYYQVDLVEALASPDIEHFLYFYLFFRGAALRPPGPGEPHFLDQARAESIRYAQDVGSDLKASVYEALRLLGRGYVSRYERADLPEPAVLRTECLALLYRLLFLFYAEHRRLLPIGKAAYDDYSLSQAAREVAADVDAEKTRSKKGGVLWGKLTTLFNMVDGGDPELNIPAYNGGLFSAKEHPLLATRGPGDRDLSLAIDLIARTRAGGGDRKRQPIDYRDLDIRHLGTIYEGLLEYQLRIADTNLVVVRTDERDAQGGRYLPHDEARDGAFDVLAEERRVKRGDAYLVTDRGERHVTGSFYTPDYIVQYIVEETLGPLVRDKTPAEILALRVVDPAMGSGHFLLAAVDYLAQAYGMARIASGEDEDGLLSDDELSDYRRQVAEHCIYGVDLNPMAVELAKLALWLKTMSRDRALTFLNNHLKCGNALLGARVEQVGRTEYMVPAKGKKSGKPKPGASAQLGLFEQVFMQRLHVLLGEVFKILTRETRTREDVQVKEDIDQIVDALRRPFLAAADVQLAALCGQTPKEIENVFGLLSTPEKLEAHPDVQAAKPIAAARRFFHWEMMFPEVFYTSKGQRRADAGFDAVIGNPPWIRQETLSADKVALSVLYREVFDGGADIYVFFMAASIELLRQGGRYGVIVPNKWQRADYGEPLRRFLVEKSRPLELMDFGHAPVFPDADTFPCILVTEKGPAAEVPMKFCAVQRDDLDGIELHSYAKRTGFDVARAQLRPEGWSPNPPDVQLVLDKMRTAGCALKEYLGAVPRYGVKTGFNEAFIISNTVRDRLVQDDPQCEPFLRKMLRGSDVGRWCPAWDGQWLIFSRRGFKIDDFPSIKKHLQYFRTSLDARAKGRWYEVQASIDYYEEFSKPKIVYQEIQFHSRFSLDLDGLFLNNKAFFLATGDTGLLGTLNSSLMWFYLWFAAPHMKDEAFAMQSFMIEQLPIIAATPELGDRLAALARQRNEVDSQFLSWMCHELEIQSLSLKLKAYWKLDEPSFLAELKKLKVKLSPAGLKEVKDEFNKSRAEILPNVAKARILEKQLHAEVFRLYGLTDEEIALVRRTAPPRDPLTLVEQGALP